MRRPRVPIVILLLVACAWHPAAQHVHTPAPPQSSSPSPSNQPDDWVALGTRIHGGFGSYVALGIRIGLDALADLNVSRGDIDVTLVDGPETRCPCIADGLLLATGATPGRATLHIDVGKAPPGVVGIVTVRHQKTHRTMRYTVLPATRARLDEWNQLEPRAKLDTIMQAPAADLYRREVIP